jgi:hypothetical protein
MAIKGEISGAHEYNDACEGSVQFRTNGAQGGDAGHGGFLEVTFQSHASVAMNVTVDGVRTKNANTVTLRFEGDSEMEYALEAIEFLARKLRASRELE